VPTAALRLLFFAVAAGLCLLVLDPFWMAMGLTLAVAGTLAPNLVPTWWLILPLGLSQFWREPSATDFVYYALLAGVHLLHLLGGLVRLLPWGGRMQLGALVRPMQRFGLVQVVAQGVAVGALLAFGGGRGRVPGLSILAAVLLVLLASVLARGIRRETSDAVLPP
jgi:hypothetical protein